MKVCSCGAAATGQGRPPRCDACRAAAYRKYHRLYQRTYRQLRAALGRPLGRAEGDHCSICHDRRALAEGLCTRCRLSLGCQSECPADPHVHCRGDGTGPCGHIIYAEKEPGQIQCRWCRADQRRREGRPGRQDAA